MRARTSVARSLRLVFIVVVVLLAVGCGGEDTSTPTPEAPQATAPPTGTAVGVTGEPTDQALAEATAEATADLPLYVAIIWHQHQPLYYKDPDTGIYQKPWVRVHATKDYLDMAAMLEGYPDVQATFNLTPTLIRQLDDLAAGAKDLYWVMAVKPADELTAEDKRFLLRRFFDTNQRIVDRFPRYRELLASRGDDLGDEALDSVAQDWSTQDFRDLQVLFNLAWTDPAWLAESPLRGLVEQGRDYTEADKVVLFEEHERIIEEVIPKHRELQDSGQIEVTMTPFAHPILPLLYATDLAREAMPDAPLPERFSYPQDAIAQVELGVEFYRDHFGRDPRGMWPAEGSVAQEIIKFVSDVGIQWMASDEEVLAKSLGMGDFTRDSREIVQEADTLFQPYLVAPRDGEPVAIVFREHRLSDKVGFEYSGMDGEAAADDLINRLHLIRDRLVEQAAGGPHLVTVLLDGENAWEHYENDGKEFLHGMYQRLSADDRLVTVTPSGYLAMLDQAPPRIDDLWPGSWINHDFSTWIGEPEENKAWEYLGEARDTLAQYTLYQRREAPLEAIQEALDNIYAAEGSDWFWWYGADQDSGDDRAFDEQFRAYLRGMYEALGEPVPAFVGVPVIPEAAAPPVQTARDLFTPAIDGDIDPEDEWAPAGYWQARGGAMARSDRVIDTLYYGFDAQNLYLRLDGVVDWLALDDRVVALYVSVPGAEPTLPFARQIDEGAERTLLGFDARHEIAIRFDEDETQATLAVPGRRDQWAEGLLLEEVAASSRVVELAVPLSEFGRPGVGDIILMRAVALQPGAPAELVPGEGIAQLPVPETGQVEVFLTVDDPTGDDFGPGTYTYPTDTVFEQGVFDITQFQVAQDEESVVFRFDLAGPLTNPWGSPNGVALQTLDVYIDTGDGGNRMLLPGRDAALTEAGAWDSAVWVEGWEGGIYRAGEGERPQSVDADYTVLADVGQSRITVLVPKQALPEGDPTTWGYLGAVMSQDGFPAAGVWRIRDVEAEASQWRLGDAPDDVNHTRIIDLVWPTDSERTQAEMLSDYPSSQADNVDALSADDFAQLEMLMP